MQVVQRSEWVEEKINSSSLMILLYAVILKGRNTKVLKPMDANLSGKNQSLWSVTSFMEVSYISV